MSHGVETKVNLTPLPCRHREQSLVEAFERLQPGETLQVIDDFDPAWIRAFFEQRFNVAFDDQTFEIEQNAGRFVAYIQKPEWSDSPEPRDPDPERDPVNS